MERINNWCSKWSPSLNFSMFLATMLALLISYIAYEGSERENKTAQENSEKNITISKKILESANKTMNIQEQTLKLHERSYVPDVAIFPDMIANPLRDGYLSIKRDGNMGTITMFFVIKNFGPARAYDIKVKVEPLAMEGAPTNLIINSHLERVDEVPSIGPNEYSEEHGFITGISFPIPSDKYYEDLKSSVNNERFSIKLRLTPIFASLQKGGTKDGIPLVVTLFKNHTLTTSGGRRLGI